MKEAFVDTSYFVGLLHRGDELHATALEVSKRLTHEELVTTELVFVELLNFFGEYGPALRDAAVTFVRKFQTNAATHVIPGTRDGFVRALERYESRRDKGYSLTDCHSMLVIEERSIVDVLTYDQHFVQAGFNALLRT